MSGPTPEGDTAAGGPTSPDEIRQDIERTRAELAHTVDQLAERVDPRVQARRTAGAMGEQLQRNRTAIGSAAALAVVSIVVIRLRSRRKGQP